MDLKDGGHVELTWDNYYALDSKLKKSQELNREMLKIIESGAILTLADTEHDYIMDLKDKLEELLS